MRRSVNQEQDGAVPRRFAYLLVWLLATGATMGASWLGLRSVLDVADSNRPAPLSAADLRRATAGATPTPTPRMTPSPKPSPTPTPSVSSPDPTQSGWIEVSDGHGGVAFQRTFRLMGGDVTVLSDSHEARVLSARPKLGFVLYTARYDYRTIVASFLSLGRVSKVMVTWRDGAPYAEVTETRA
jgi:hypothetical protein